MSCARWITCPPLYSVEAIEASVEASVEASIEVASRLSVEAASRRRGQGSASPELARQLAGSWSWDPAAAESAAGHVA